MKKVLFFFPHNPYPPKTGAHKRCLELLFGLHELGYQVVFASSTLTDSPWSESSIKKIRELYGCAVKIYSPGNFDSKLTYYIKKYFPSCQNKFNAWGTVGMKYWLKGVVKAFQPDLFFMNYAYFDGLVTKKLLSRQTSVIEIHDLVTLNQKMQEIFISATRMDNISLGYLPESVLDLGFYKNKSLTAEQNEFDIYDNYKYTLCISESERMLVAQNAPNTRAVHLPMTHNTCSLNNNYADSALFTVGPNSFNVQGYYFFLDKVLPLVKVRCPDFQLTVTGSFFYHFIPRVAGGVTFQGFVDDLRGVYENAAFFICPVFGGTGQQVKIVEAMAHGLPVVALRDAADKSPVRHEINGLIADSADEFAEHVIRLWRDRKLCRRLGEEARHTIEQEFSRECLVSALATLL